MARTMWRVSLAVLLLASSTVAQTVTARNWTSSTAAEEDGHSVTLYISEGKDIGIETQTMVALANILPWTQDAAQYTPASDSLSGDIFLANASSLSNITDNDVAFISCDLSEYAGYIGATDVFSSAVSLDAMAIVWYTRQAAYCDFTGYDGSYTWIYSMKSANATKELLARVAEGADAVLLQGTDDVAVNSNSSSGAQSSGSNDNNNSQNQNSNPLGPSPGTAVAMIILYSITGIITGLFLLIIITGAVRAHRHPERYGPRFIAGRARQSRARGLARAMLDTIPIVKFGEREQPKTTDVELAGAGTADREVTAQREAPDATAQPADSTPGPDEVERSVQESQPMDNTTDASGIAAATPLIGTNASTDQDNQGCSICTEDFQVGEDQRVLPCDHRFHPACIDPWLLNVSGTCPLCRIDLRPSRTNESLDENGNPIRRRSVEGEELPPPLATLGPDTRRMSVRRSLLIGLLGASTLPSRMTREGRLHALREYRLRQAARDAQRQRERPAGSSSEATSAGESSAQAGAASEEDAGLRTRLRNAFRVRTRRTGGDEGAPHAGSSDSAMENRENRIPRSP